MHEENKIKTKEKTWQQMKHVLSRSWINRDNLPDGCYRPSYDFLVKIYSRVVCAWLCSKFSRYVWYNWYNFFVFLLIFLWLIKDVNIFSPITVNDCCICQHKSMCFSVHMEFYSNGCCDIHVTLKHVRRLTRWFSTHVFLVHVRTCPIFVVCLRVITVRSL